MTPRPSWDSIWMSTADVVAQRSRCTRRKIGAVIVDAHNRPIAMGYNGPPANWKGDSGEDLYANGALVRHISDGSDCREWCPRALKANVGADYADCVTIHAEINALLFADRRDFSGGTIYVTSVCCWDCGKAIANSGLKRVVTRVNRGSDGHRLFQRTIDLLTDCGMEVSIV
ncbi:MAG: deaminase [Candidatus Moraniibacteriota bacterium]